MKEQQDKLLYLAFPQYTKGQKEINHLSTSIEKPSKKTRQVLNHSATVERQQIAGVKKHNLNEILAVKKKRGGLMSSP